MNPCMAKMGGSPSATTCVSNMMVVACRMTCMDSPVYINTSKCSLTMLMLIRHLSNDQIGTKE